MFRSLQEDIVPNTLTVKEIIELLHIHEQTVRRWANNGLLKAYRVGPRRDRRFSPDDLATFLEKNALGNNGGHQSS